MSERILIHAGIADSRMYRRQVETLAPARAFDLLADLLLNPRFDEAKASLHLELLFTCGEQQHPPVFAECVDAPVGEQRFPSPCPILRRNIPMPKCF